MHAHGLSACWPTRGAFPAKTEHSRLYTRNFTLTQIHDRGICLIISTNEPSSVFVSCCVSRRPSFASTDILTYCFLLAPYTPTQTYLRSFCFLLCIPHCSCYNRPESTHGRTQKNSEICAEPLSCTNGYTYGGEGKATNPLPLEEKEEKNSATRYKRGQVGYEKKTKTSKRRNMNMDSTRYITINMDPPRYVRRF